MHTVKDKAKLLARVKRIQGQASALEKLLAQEQDCAAILQQIAAIRGAVNGLMGAVIKGHLVDHLVEEESLSARQQEAEAILQVIKSYLK
ncbi:MAG: metal/formaldehyde-sensitive transcriptional repressor [Pseudomonadota bacterium]|uniref:metal/formaldehyde-sensitive transcriptional repressor n=1 Tax=Gallaecimonas pentaromativorans TaxID=584787 RepID=UPI00067F145F|nr:metal/formaldehyde-sensitive transcriptional repressor [Gallaecimonas pentaromativorans]MED5526622.1 metal/formaldehyde-sensitive transcriptional repressor [Pseudomonadota bacterium]